MRIHFIVGTIAWLGLIPSALSWDGVDAYTGESIEIEKGNLVRSGRDIEVYDYGTGQYHDFTIDDINRRGSTVEIEGYDNTTGEFRTFELDD